MNPCHAKKNDNYRLIIIKGVNIRRQYPFCGVHDYDIGGQYDNRR